MQGINENWEGLEEKQRFMPGHIVIQHIWNKWNASGTLNTIGTPSFRDQFKKMQCAHPNHQRPVRRRFSDGLAIQLNIPAEIQRTGQTKVAIATCTPCLSGRCSHRSCGCWLMRFKLCLKVSLHLLHFILLWAPRREPAQQHIQWENWMLLTHRNQFQTQRVGLQ